MEYIKWFDELTKDSGPIAGGKGANLAEMANLRLPVPPGFVVTTKAFDKFIEFNQVKEKIQGLIEGCDVDDTEELMQTSKNIKQLILGGEYPQAIKYEITQSYNKVSLSRDIELPAIIPLLSAGREYAIVAVRSSATAEDLPTASFAGQQATSLNVKGITDLIEKVKECWASLYEPRAIFYRAKHDVKRTSIAVIVQRMIASEKSGVMFTINPSTGEENIMIESTWGLGETLVQGEVEPDRYIISKTGEMIEKTIGVKTKMRVRDMASDKTIEIPVPRDKINQQVLNDNEILKIANYGLILEEHYQKPQDVEFAIEKNRIYLVQTRAVTTEAKGVTAEAEVEEKKIKGEPILKGLGVSPGIATGTVRIVYKSEDFEKIQKGDILVTEMTSPDMVVVMSRSAAIVTDSGGATCHAAIVGREMGLPVIVGAQSATKTLQNGQLVTVDAYHGLVYPGEIAVEKPIVEEEVKEKAKEKVETKTLVKVNLAFILPNLEDIASKTDGIGLLRIEHMITKSGIHPAKLIREGKKEEYIKILLDGIKPIAQAFHPKPIWVRTLDARSDEFRNLEGGEDEPREDNPMLGWHGIRRSLDEPELLKAEFEAIKVLHEEGLNNVHIMLPFIISVEELRKAKDTAKEILPETAKLGIMVETAAAALIIEDFCKEGIGFASIGSNDLTQSVLCVDRNNARISGLYSEFHPAVLNLMEHTIKTCSQYGVESSICGESGSNPEMAKLLVGFGIKSISCNIDAIDKIKQTVHELEEDSISV
jgi:pyruvate,water dikinase